MALKEGWTTYHVAWSIRGLLGEGDRALAAICRGDHGEHLSGFAVRNKLCDMLKRGLEVVPHPDCDHHAAEGNCLGHPVVEAEDWQR